MSPLDGRLGPKHPPHSIEAEQSVLGGLLLRNQAWPEVSGILSAEDFYTQDHRTIFTAIAELMALRKPCDFVTLTEHLRQQKRIAEAGGMAYLGTLAADATSASNVAAHAGIVRERSTLRSLIALGQDIAILGYETHGREATELLREADRLFASLRGRGVSDAMTFGQAATAALEDIERSRGERAAGRPPGVPYGIPALDRATGGRRPGDLIGVAARTSVGKTAFAVQSAVYAAAHQHPGLFLTLEENPIAVALRAIATTGGVNLTAMRGGFPEAVDQANRAVVNHGMSNLPLWVDSRTFNLAPICAKITRYVRTEGIKFAVVDHAGLVNVSARNGAKRYEQVGEVTRTLKQLAEELNISIDLLVQIGRESAKLGKRPQLFDLRESGNIEQDLSTCIALHPVGPDGEETQDCQTLEVGLLKNRYGHRGWMKEKLRFTGGIQRFEQEVAVSEIDAYADLPPPVRSFADPEDWISP